MTVSGRPVAELVPLARRPRSVRWQELMHDVDDWRADAALTDELKQLVPDTTDDVPVP